MAVNWTDPCARAEALRGAYFALVSGQSEQTVRFRSNDAEQEVRFQAANLDVLRTELRAAEAECAAAQGAAGRPRRFAITAGSFGC